MNWLKLLDRIGATSTRANLETLVHLQRQALLALLFENLDIHLARVIRLDHDSLYRKIVAGDRGGFCYELNECFYQCLAAMGYMVERLEARVELGGPGDAFDHQCSLVHLDGARWLADIGFGDSSASPSCWQSQANRMRARHRTLTCCASSRAATERLSPVSGSHRPYIGAPWIRRPISRR